MDAAARRDPRAHGRRAPRGGRASTGSGVDAAIFLGPVACGLVGEAHTGLFVSAVGAGALAVSIRLARGSLRSGAVERAPGRS